MPVQRSIGGLGPRRISRARTRAAVGLTVAALTAGATAGAGPAVAQPKTAAAAAADCSAAYKIEQKLSTGTTWHMCWRYDSKAGLVLENVSYQPKGEAKPIKVLNSARLAQIDVPYDDGSVEYDDLTGFGFAQGLVDLAPGECPGGTIKTIKVPDGDPEHPNVKGLCTTTRSRGHAYRMQGNSANKVFQTQGKDLLVYTVNKVGWYEYMTEWRFQDDGTINMNVGATGSLSYDDYDAGDGRGWPIGKGAKAYATSHSHNVFWRLDFGLDGSSRTKVEQYDSAVTAPARGQQAPTNKTTRTPVTKELAGDYKTYRWWRVVSGTGKNKDGHARSYEIVPGPTTKYPGRSFTKHDVYFTEYNKCEQFASNNLGACPTGAGKSVDTWVNGQNLTHPVVWMNVGFHHIARDEDQQPMPIHWQGFAIAPRDVTAMNPLTPDEVAWQNGHWQPRS
ncbi:primary-amine oxidase [Streptomyces griseochromogenes]|uniref:Amine oxidase n=1 Tax=Streptomyces griseochromogenes TaxID=68214 RepID=A0A1B1AUI8_9ACTN|nr:copper amine oxidase [Streptomyces griseochromogenes]ANP50248.1 copper amine oxidase [Streptomyces griseochromogenes]MBP2048101.1 primary-amine oxidase [Streptomyces griseochromogenes]